ncbi:hypothetical protein THAOC_03870, partial [Thalassiosira oceanica]
GYKVDDPPNTHSTPTDFFTVEEDTSTRTLLLYTLGNRKLKNGGDAQTMISLRWLPPLLLLVEVASAFSPVSTTAAATTPGPGVGNWRHGVTNHQQLSTLSSEVNGDGFTEGKSQLNGFQRFLTRTLMCSYITSMCVALPTTLFPIYLLHKFRIIDRAQKEKTSLRVGQFCSRWMMRVFPFASKKVVVDRETHEADPRPTIWACNHISMLDVFFVLALDKRMRGKKRRPIKILYWKGLESNPVTRLLFQMCGFIPVEMEDNGNGNKNQYDPKSFKSMLKSTKQAIEEGFDIGILPEGQPNPTPELGLQPVYGGAFTLARMSRRPIQMLSLYGLHKMWHPDGSMGCSQRQMKVRVYPQAERMYKDAEEFATTFEAVSGTFGATGRDLPKQELQMWLDGTMWQTELARRASVETTKQNQEDQRQPEDAKIGQMN